MNKTNNMKKSRLLIILVSSFLYSCGGTQIGNTKEAIDYLESHKFYDDDASIKGKSGSKINSGFSIQFESGMAILGSEMLEYNITRIGKDYKITFCGSSRYAYGGCIDVSLTSGEDGGYPSLSVKGDYIYSYMNSKYDDQVKEK